MVHLFELYTSYIWVHSPNTVQEFNQSSFKLINKTKKILKSVIKTDYLSNVIYNDNTENKSIIKK